MCFVPLGTVCWLLNTSECAVLPFVERYMFDSFAYTPRPNKLLEHLFTYRSYGTICIATFFSTDISSLRDVLLPNCCSSMTSSPARVFQNHSTDISSLWDVLPRTAVHHCHLRWLVSFKTIYTWLYHLKPKCIWIIGFVDADGVVSEDSCPAFYAGFNGRLSCYRYFFFNGAVKL